MIHKLKGSVCLIGDIHGVYDPRETGYEKIADNYVFLGDIGFGFDNLRAFTRTLNRHIPKGVKCYFIRGNHDDPSCWKGVKEKTITRIVPRFTMVHDYDLMVIEGKKYLCVGGGISIDRHYREEGKSYWSDEAVLPCPDENVYGEVYGVLSHTGFTPPVMTHKHAYQMKFPDVNQDCQDEQELLREILHVYNPQVWYNGHYHVNRTWREENCIVHALDISEHKIITELS